MSGPHAKAGSIAIGLTPQAAEKRSLMITSNHYWMSAWTRHRKFQMIGTHAVVILALLIFFALILAAGFSYFIRKVKPLALVVLLVSAAACWWVVHYLNVLSLQTDMAQDLQWHRIYMICLLVLIPSSLVVGGILGLIKQQKDYLAQYPSGDDRSS